MSEDKVHASAVRLISYRPRSEHELRAKLLEKKFCENEIEAEIEYLKEAALIDDKAFALELTSSRIRNKCWGRRKIIFDLKSKGISEELITLALSEIVAPAEMETVAKAARKWTRKRGVSIPLSNDDRIKAARYLESLGFTTGLAITALKNIETQDYDV